MKSREIQYIEQKLDEDFDLDQFRAAFPGVKTFPLIMQNDRRIGGYVELVEACSADPYFGKMILNEGT